MRHQTNRIAVLTCILALLVIALGCTVRLKADTSHAAGSFAITAPLSNAVIQGRTVPLSVQTDGLPQIRSVEYQVDGRTVAGPLTSPPFSTTLDSIMVIDGPRELHAIARDLNGTIVAEDTVSVTVRNFGGIAQLASPDVSRPLSGTVTWQFVVDPSTPMTGQPLGHFFVDGIAVGGNVANPPYVFTLDTTRYPDGPHEAIFSLDEQTINDSPTNPAAIVQVRAAFTVLNALHPVALTLPWLDQFLQTGASTTLDIQSQMSDGSIQTVAQEHRLLWSEDFSTDASSRWDRAHSAATWVQGSSVLQQTAQLQTLQGNNLVATDPLFATEPISNDMTAKVRFDSDGPITQVGIGLGAADPAAGQYANAYLTFDDHTASDGATHCLRLDYGNAANAAVNTQPAMPALTCIRHVWYRLHLRVIDQRLFAKVWLDGTPEPTAWMLSAPGYQTISTKNKPFLTAATLASFGDIKVSRVPLLFWNDDPTVASADDDGAVQTLTQGLDILTVFDVAVQPTSLTLHSLTSLSSFNHFAKDGAILPAYDPVRSHFARSMANLGEGNIASRRNLLPYLQDAGIDTTEDGFYDPIGSGSTMEQVQQWQQHETAKVAAATDFLKQHNLSSIILGDNESSFDMRNTILNPLSKAAYGFYMTLLRDSGVFGHLEIKDEADNWYGAWPKVWRGNDLPMTALMDFLGYIKAVPNHIPFTFPIFFDTDRKTAENYFGDPDVSDYQSFYWSLNNGQPTVLYRTTMNWFLTWINRPFYLWAPGIVKTRGEMATSMLTATEGLENRFIPGVSQLADGGSPVELGRVGTTAQVLFGLAKGISGTRAYKYGFGDNAGHDPGINPFSSMTDQWQAMAAGNRLILQLERDLLQPKISGPALGISVPQGANWLVSDQMNSLYAPSIITGAREGPFSRLLIAVNMYDQPQTVTVDLSPYAYAGGPSILRYHLKGTALWTDSLPGTQRSDVITLAPGEGLIYVFHTPSQTDVTAPDIQIISPLADSTISGKELVKLEADDDTGIDHIDLFSDGVKLATLTGSTRTYWWDTNVLKPGIWHNVSAVAYDAAGNHSEARTGVSIAARTVIDPIIVDNADSGYSETGVGWTVGAGGPTCYHNGTRRVHAGGNGDATASWTFGNLKPGKYLVETRFASCYPDANLATSAPFSVYDGSTLAFSTVKNMSQVESYEGLNTGLSYFPVETWDDLGTATVTSGTLTVTLSDTVNGFVSADAVRLVPAYDITVPVIASVTVTPSPTSVTIQWQTDVPTHTQVAYGITSDVDRIGPTSDTPLSLSHSIQLDSLSTGNTYHLRLRATDAAGATGVSDDITLQAGGACQNPVTRLKPVGVKGGVPVVATDKELVDCAVLEPGLQYLIYTPAGMNLQNLDAALTRLADGGKAKYYAYRFSDYGADLEGQNAGATRFLQRFPGVFAASDSALSDPVLGPKLQSLTSQTGVIWQKTDGSVGSLPLAGHQLYLIVVAEEAALRAGLGTVVIP
jgi:hypothetical protein